MGIVSLKKNKTENTLVVARISTEVSDILKMNNINVSKTIREYLIGVANDLKAMRSKKLVS